MVIFCGINSNCCPFLSWGNNQIKTTQVAPFMGFGFSNCRTSLLQSTTGFTVFTMKVRIIPSVKCHLYQNGQLNSNSEASNKKIIKKVRKKEQHLWKKRESTGSGKKALNLVRIVSELPNEKEAVYGALDKWTAWETEFPLIATAKALNMLRQRGQWRRVIQVAKWMLSKGQGATMGICRHGGAGCKTR
ncbi:pentatricopeptide repeat-containing protein At4g18975, chloroplastic isoform X4 [Pistacia vera]|uniref:pentatricopeptide repeat-containing protein At4g18975, chloroplastic isoform X4 n=1 Tax=Pistacia vera TaxID=55513 RepID=UPI001263DE6E|nr:pentatricopeptide repeat-containing protein At4g18975, chloroplastic isoform X4 [Pistacia vera]